MVMIVARLSGYVNFVDGSLVEWDGGWVVVWLGWLDDGGCVGCLGFVREMTMGKNEYFIK